MINLMPPELKESIKFGSYNVSVTQYMILVVMSGIALAAVIAFGVQIVRADESKLEKSIQAKQNQLVTYEKDIAAAKKLSEQIDTVDVLLDHEIRFSVLLQEIGGLMPPGATLSHLTLTNDLDKNLTLTATVASEEIATQLQQNLLGSDLFTGADIQTITSTQGDGGALVVDILVSYDKEAVELQL